MPRTRRLAKTRRTELTLDQEMELLLGPAGRGVTDFASPFLRRAAWLAHKASLMEDDPPGMRPWAWWEYEVGHHPTDAGIDGQARELRRLKLLSDAEKGLLAATKVRA